MNIIIQNTLVFLAFLAAIWVVIRHFYPKKQIKKGCGSSNKNCGC